jgi:hypothetical protein
MSFPSCSTVSLHSEWSKSFFEISVYSLLLTSLDLCGFSSVRRWMSGDWSTPVMSHLIDRIHKNNSSLAGPCPPRVAFIRLPSAPLPPLRSCASLRSCAALRSWLASAHPPPLVDGADSQRSCCFESISAENYSTCHGRALIMAFSIRDEPVSQANHQSQSDLSTVQMQVALPNSYPLLKWSPRHYTNAYHHI